MLDRLLVARLRQSGQYNYCHLTVRFWANTSRSLLAVQAINYIPSLAFEVTCLCSRCAYLIVVFISE
jgi:hypothetical protein